MSKESKEIYEFGPFRLDVGEHLFVRTDGVKNGTLPEKAFQTLTLLVRNHGRLITKTEILEAVWPDSFVEENNLDKAIHAIRHALGERSGKHSYIETVRKHGYRFVAEVRTISAADDGAETQGLSAQISDDLPGILGASRSGSALASGSRFRSAFEAYQQAKIKYQQMTAPTSVESRELIAEALRLDPDFTLAHCLSAELTTLEVIVGLKWPEPGFAEARGSIRRAAELGADSAEFYSAAAYVDLIADWNFRAAAEKLRKALALSPHHAPAHRILGEVYMFQGQHSEAAGHIERAQADLELQNLNILAIGRFLARDYPEVLEVADRMLSLSPDNIIPAWTKCWVWEQTGRTEEAIDGYEKILQLPYGEPALRWIGYAYAVAGDRPRALETASRLEAASREHNLSPTHLAAVYSALGEIDRAVDYVRKGLEMRDPFMLWIVADPRFDRLRGDPGFDEIVRAVLEKGTPSRARKDIPAFRRFKTLPKPQITESGQHALLDLHEWREVVQRLEGENTLAPLLDAKGPEDQVAIHQPIPTEAPDETPENMSQGQTAPEPMVRYGIWIALLGTLIVLAIAGMIGVSLLQTRTQNVFALDQRRLTTGGSVTRVAMSPDGRYAAVVQNAAVKLFDLSSGGENVLIQAEPGIRILTIAFHPDGNDLYFGRRNIETTPVELFKVPIKGGQPTKVLDDIYGSLTFSPDGKRFAFVRRYAELNEFNLLTADTDGSNIVKLASSQMPNRFEGAPAWSPDGKAILCPAVGIDGGFHYRIAKIHPATGLVEMLPGRWTWLLSIVWLQEEKRILVTGQGEGEVNSQLWRVDTETGSATRVTNDSFLYESISGTAAGDNFVAVKVQHSSHVWILNGSPVQITSGFDKYDGVDGIAWAKDGSIFYHSRASGREAIWKMKQDGSQASEVTTDSGGGFALSPDGRFLAFERQEADAIGLHLMDLGSGSVRALTPNMMASTPEFSSDGKTVLFSHYDKKLSLFEVPISGGAPRVLSNEYQAARAPAVSPSGRYVAFAFNRAQTGELQSGIAVMDNASKKVVSIFPIKSGLGSNYEKPTIQWSNDESELYFIQIDLPSSTSNLAKLRIADGTISKVTHFNAGRVFNFAVEPGGNRIVLARGTVERDAALIKTGQ